MATKIVCKNNHLQLYRYVKHMLLFTCNFFLFSSYVFIKCLSNDERSIRIRCIAILIYRLIYNRGLIHTHTQTCFFIRFQLLKSRGGTPDSAIGSSKKPPQLTSSSQSDLNSRTLQTNNIRAQSKAVIYIQNDAHFCTSNIIRFFFII